MTIRRKMKWKVTHRKIRGVRRKVKVHRKRVLDGYLVRVVRKRGRHHRVHHSYGKHHSRHHRGFNPAKGIHLAKQMKLFGSR
jgi:hypothetical protein